MKKAKAEIFEARSKLQAAAGRGLAWSLARSLAWDLKRAAGRVFALVFGRAFALVFRRAFALVFALAFFGGLAPDAAEAKKRKKRSARGKNRQVHIDFDDELHIKGKLLSPSIFTLIQKKNMNYGKLIRLRKNFLPEMRETKEDIK